MADRVKKLRIFLDADVIFAGSAAPSVQGASYVVLRMGEITLLNCITSEQVITEVDRNLRDKITQGATGIPITYKTVCASRARS